MAKLEPRLSRRAAKGLFVSLLVPLGVLVVLALLAGAVWLLMPGILVAILLQAAFYIAARWRHSLLASVYAIACAFTGATLFNYLSFLWVPLTLRPFTALLFFVFTLLSWVEASLLYVRILPCSPFSGAGGENR